MALFNKPEPTKAKSMAESVYDKAVLQAHDGKLHAVMFKSFSKLGNEVFSCDEKYTKEINEILDLMQRDGYEIVDVKVSALANQGLTGQRDGFNTVILYR